MADINMTGWNVEYKGIWYECLSMSQTLRTVTIGELTYKDAVHLCVHAIDQDAQLVTLNDISWEFRFYRAR